MDAIRQFAQRQPQASDDAGPALNMAFRTPAPSTPMSFQAQAMNPDAPAPGGDAPAPDGAELTKMEKFKAFLKTPKGMIAAGGVVVTLGGLTIWLSVRK